MPLFSSRREPSPETYEPEPMQMAPDQQVPQKKHSIFSRHRDSSPTHTNRTTSTRSSNAAMAAGAEPGYFGNSGSPGGYHNGNANGHHNGNTNGLNHSNSINGSSGGGSRLSNLFHRDNGVNGAHTSLDPSITQVRDHIYHAEQAEAEADRALGEARMRVREAKDHLWRLEEEAKEEARRAKIKQEQAREVSKRGKGLGRHGL